jgi:AmmeMemoRadiSam system protein A
MTAPLSPVWLSFARQVVAIAAHRGDAGAVIAPPDDRPHSGVFVTLHKFGRLRGCMGTLDPSLGLAEAVRRAAVCATLQDPRFDAVAPGEVPDLKIELSVLTPPVPMNSLDDLVLGEHGIIVQRGQRRGLFLPQVATEHHFDRETLLARCCTEKAGLPADAWRQPGTQVLLFTAAVLQEE